MDKNRITQSVQKAMKYFNEKAYADALEAAEMILMSVRRTVIITQRIKEMRT